MPDAVSGPALLRWLPEYHPDAAPADALAQVVFAPGRDALTCPLAWLGGDFRGETWRMDARIDTGTAHGWVYRAHPRLAFAAIHIDDGEQLDQPDTIQQAAYAAYRGLFALQRELGLGHVQRLWHWLSAVTRGDGDDQRYQRFCRGRAEALDTAAGDTASLPPATLVGSAARGLRMHALLGDTPITPVENPRQVSAYRYPRSYGLRAPAFARAGLATLAGTDYLLISGTASIVGHASHHSGDIDSQAREALANLEAVVAAAGERAERVYRLADAECIKAYIRHADHAMTVETLLRHHLPGVPLALLHAPLCREELLVEYEAQLRLGPH